MRTLGDVAVELAAEWIAQHQPSVPSNRMEFLQFSTGLCPLPLFDALMNAGPHLDWVLAAASMKVERYRRMERAVFAHSEDDGA